MLKMKSPVTRTTRAMSYYSAIQEVITSSPVDEVELCGSSVEQSF